MNTLNVLLIEDSPEYSALVLQWLSGDPNNAEFSLVWTDSLAAALARLRESGIDLILMDLGLPDSDGLKTFKAIRTAREDLPIVVLSSVESQTLALQTIREGAEDYLLKSSCTPDLLVRTLQHAVARHQLTTDRACAVQSAGLARVIGVLGSAGGVGTTAVASVFAAEIRRQTEQSTLLIDLDSNPGLVAFTMGIHMHPGYTLQDLADNAERLDPSLWEAMITRGPGDLEVLTSARTIAALVNPDTDGLRKVVRFAAGHYRWIVLDLGRLNGTSRQLLESADDFLLVSAQSLSALHQCKYTIGMLTDLGIKAECVRLVLNQLDERNQWPRRELENLFGVPIAAVLPPAHADLQAACIEKRLPDVSTGFRLALTAVARNIAGLSGEVSERPKFSLTSLTDRFRWRQPKEELASQGG